MLHSQEMLPVATYAQRYNNKIITGDFKQPEAGEDDGKKRKSNMLKCRLAIQRDGTAFYQEKFQAGQIFF